MEAFNPLHAKALYYRFCAIYGEKFVKPYHDDAFRAIWYEDWISGLEGVDPRLIKDALAHCKLNLEWAPSIAEFRRICERYAGVPSADDALNAAIRRDFAHPVTSIAYERVGSWAMKNDKQEALRTKFQAAYTEALDQFRTAPDKAWAHLEALKAKPELPAPLPKVPSEVERMGFRERLKYYTDLANAAKAHGKEKSHTSWPIDYVTYGSKLFDEKLYAERRAYLLALDEKSSASLCADDQYDRIRFLREEIGRSAMQGHQPTQSIPPKEKTSPRAYNSAKRPFDRWSD